MSLRERTQYHLQMPRKIEPFQPTVGDVVQIKDELSRGHWKLGKIQELITSRDGHHRVAQILLPDKKILIRAVKHLYPLEIPPKDMDDSGETKGEVQKKGKVQAPKDDVKSPRPIRAAAKRALEQLSDHFSRGSVVDYGESSDSDED